MIVSSESLYYFKGLCCVKMNVTTAPLNEALASLAAVVETNATDLSNVWVLVCAFLVILMQGGKSEPQNPCVKATKKKEEKKEEKKKKKRKT